MRTLAVRDGRIVPVSRVYRGAGRVLIAAADPLQHRQDVAAELGRVLAHGKVTEGSHDRDLGARDLAGGALGVLRGAGEIVFSREEKKRTDFRVDLPHPLAQVAVDPIE